MSRKLRVFLYSLGGFLALTFVGFFWAFLYVPEFYNRTLKRDIDPLVEQEEVKKFTQTAAFLMEDMKYGEKDWSREIGKSEINSWLSSELKANFADLVPQGASEPRVHFEGDSIVLGFRYRPLWWNPVVSIRVKPWVMQDYRLALEIEAIRVGLLPIPLEQVLKKISREFESDGASVEWRTSDDGNDVMIVRLAQSKKQTSILSKIDVSNGSIRLSGTSKRNTRN